MTAKKIKLILTIVLIVLAVLLGILTVVMMRKSKSLRRNESLGIADETSPFTATAARGSSQGNKNRIQIQNDS